MAVFFYRPYFIFRTKNITQTANADLYPPPSITKHNHTFFSGDGRFKIRNKSTQRINRNHIETYKCLHTNLQDICFLSQPLFRPMKPNFLVCTRTSLLPPARILISAHLDVVEVCGITKNILKYLLRRFSSLCSTQIV